MANPIVTNLPQFVKTNANELLYKAATGANTLKHIRIQPGIWGRGAINVITPTIALDGAPCGFSENSTAAITQRNIVTGQIIVNSTFCDDAVRNTYLEEKFNANGHITDADFFDKFTAAYTNAVATALETKLWGGGTSQGDPFDGFVIQLVTDGTYKQTGQTPLTSSSTPAQVWEYVLGVVATMPANLLTNGDGRIFMGEDLFAKLVVGLINANLYNYSVAADGEGGLKIPGTNVLAVATSGLSGQNVMISGDRNNFVFGTGFGAEQRPEENFSMIYDEADQIWKLIIKFTAGVGIIAPDEVIFQ